MIELNGVLPVDKPAGPTSHDVVARARRALGLRRIGHTGTLDPFASGLLLLCLGQATRLAEYLTALPKRYRATMLLGISTDTDDLTGTTLHSSDEWRDLAVAEVEGALNSQVGTILQRPPAYSAKRVQGERMYEAARRGEVVEREPVEVRIESINIVRMDLPEIEFDVECGSGTYIRAIARDVGEKLGVGGHLSALRRTAIGSFPVERSVSLSDLEGPQAAEEVLLTPTEALGHLANVVLEEDEVEAIRHGRAVQAVADAPDEEPLALLSPERKLVAVGARRHGTIRPRKVLA